MLDKIEKFIEENLDINVGKTMLGLIYVLMPLICFVSLLMMMIIKNFCNPEQQEFLDTIFPLALIIFFISFGLSIILYEILITFLLALIDILKKRKEKYESKYKREIN